MPEFTGAGSPLSEDGVQAFRAATGTGNLQMWAVVAVETSGCGFLSDRRPKILFERHIFHALTGGKYDQSHPDISQPTQGGYGAGGANQYNRLAEAVLLDRDNALQSASWGLGQIMGNNFRSAGFPNLGAMVDAMVASEDNQIAAMANFLVANHLAAPLNNQDWVSFARGYNGPDYAQGNYDGLLERFYGIFASGLQVPDIIVRQAQMWLLYKDFDPKGIDGILGQNTISAIEAFQSANGFAATGALDGQTLTALRS